MQSCLGIKIKNVKELEAITVKTKKGFIHFISFEDFVSFLLSLVKL